MISRYMRFGWWFLLALVGQAVALQVIDAGPFIHYQHYKPLAEIVQRHPLLTGFLALQSILVVVGIKTHWGLIRGWLHENFSIWQLVAMGVVVCLASTAASRDASVYVSELLFASFVQFVNLGNIVLMIWHFPLEKLPALKQAAQKILGPPEDEGEGSRVDRVAVSAAVWTMVIAAVLSFFVYGGYPHIQDEVLYFYQARYFANGALSVPAPPVPAAFSFYMIPHEADRWYSIFPPGWAALLAIGVLAGAPWLVNPLLAGVSTLLVFPLLVNLYDRRTARIGVILLCSSPWFLFMGMNLMSHMSTLTFTLAASVAVIRARGPAAVGWASVGGACAGVVGLIRPLDGLIVAVLVGLWAAGIAGPRLKVSAIVAFVLFALAVNSLQLPYNKALTGEMTQSPLMTYYDKYHGPGTNALGFGPERGLGWEIDAFPGHSPVEALINAGLNTFSINVELFGWSTGSLILVVLFLFSRNLRRSDYLMVATIAAIVGAYSLYWFNGGPDFGARYWFLTLVPLAALTVRGMQFLSGSVQLDAASQKLGGQRRPAPYSGAMFHDGRVVAAVGTLCLLALVNYFPWRAVDKYYHYLGMRPDIPELAKEYNFGRSLVLVRGKAHPDYTSAWIYNSLDYNTDGPIFAWDRSLDVRSQLIRAYPDRPVWIVEGPTITRGAFRLAAGPLAANTLLMSDYQR